jgi:hypothetical protein
MKKLTYTTAIFVAMAATSVFAHHPSEGVNPNFDIVDEQISDMHDQMLPDDMGASTASGDSDMAEATQESAGGVNTARSGLTDPEQPQTGEGPGMDAAAAAGTIDLMENVE